MANGTHFLSVVTSSTVIRGALGPRATQEMFLLSEPEPVVTPRATSTVTVRSTVRSTAVRTTVRPPTAGPKHTAGPWSVASPEFTTPETVTVSHQGRCRDYPGPWFNSSGISMGQGNLGEGMEWAYLSPLHFLTWPVPRGSLRSPLC